jgi:hypothetical protein
METPLIWMVLLMKNGPICPIAKKFGWCFELEAYGEGCGTDVGGELPLERAAALELIAGRDDPETHGVWIAVADPSVNNVVLVIQ